MAAILGETMKLAMVCCNISEIRPDNLIALNADVIMIRSRDTSDMLVSTKGNISFRGFI